MYARAVDGSHEFVCIREAMQDAFEGRALLKSVFHGDQKERVLCIDGPKMNDKEFDKACAMFWYTLGQIVMERGWHVHPAILDGMMYYSDRDHSGEITFPKLSWNEHCPDDQKR